MNKAKEIFDKLDNKGQINFVTKLYINNDDSFFDYYQRVKDASDRVIINVATSLHTYSLFVLETIKILQDGLNYVDEAVFNSFTKADGNLIETLKLRKKWLEKLDYSIELLKGLRLKPELISYYDPAEVIINKICLSYITQEEIDFCDKVIGEGIEEFRLPEATKYLTLAQKRMECFRKYLEEEDAV